uniref:Uncharacterized protein n=1 Tax=Colobus angolensis palliatus TaxID=336983 RepID=A0A2K5JI06_COLAP
MSKSFQILISKAIKREAFRMAHHILLVPTWFCPWFRLSVKAPACNTPSHFTLHVRQQTKSTNGVN